MKGLFVAILSAINGWLKGKPTVKRLRKWGAIVGEDVELISVICGKKDATCLEIGNHVTLTYVEILTHDASPQHFLGYGINRIGRVVIGDNVFVGRHTIILPNVKIGSNVIVGAGSIVTKDIPNNVVVAGNPAKVICSIEEWIEKQNKKMENNIFWNFDRDKLSKDELAEFNKRIDGRIVYLGRKK